ncbi:MAG: PfkB family carbohydrate kinase [Verrucomicrobiota bacterium]|nr:PfkB family carbohydrate kinase [Verrucomicrobiota bacterium]
MSVLNRILQHRAPDKMSPSVKLVIVGSVGLDTIETPFGRGTDMLGGSLSYACAAAAFFTRVGMVGVVGSDFPRRCVKLYRRFGIDLQGLQRVQGRTLRWSGVYEADMNNRQTLATELNVFERFRPELPEAYRSAPFSLLGNISPQLQLHVLSQVRQPRFVAADTMDLWIRTARSALMDVIGRVDLLTINESEARLLTGGYHIKACARKVLAMGPQWVVIKKGEHGAMLFGRDCVGFIPPFPLEGVKDPTGAGDAFAGAFMGRLAQRGRCAERVIREALLYGSVVASFGVEEFGVSRLARLRKRDIERRAAALKRM